jgi:mannan polymerase II complex MNN11 subunit
MHFALPPRKTSARPPAYQIKPRRGGVLDGRLAAASDRLQALRRSRPAAALAALLGAAAALLLLLRLLRAGGRGPAAVGVAAPVAGAGGRVRSGADVVLVTAFDPVDDAALWADVQRNREQYAKRHGTCCCGAARADG